MDKSVIESILEKSSSGESLSQKLAESTASMKEIQVSAELGDYASAKELRSGKIASEGMEIKWRGEDYRLED